MPENTNTPANNTAENTTPAAEPTTPVAPSRNTRKPREKVRPLDILKGIENVKSLSDKEKNILIEHYRAELNRTTAMCNCYKNNSEEAFKKARMLEDAYNHMLEVNDARLNDMVQAASTFYKTIFLIAKDGKKNND